MLLFETLVPAKSGLAERLLGRPMRAATSSLIVALSCLWISFN